ncbi:BNR repeat-like domain-containing protein [Jiangella sp. DSM 45060]|nr:BNR repeat-like domain-containing protein [Jiangella sp. DSM 45060]
MISPVRRVVAAGTAAALLWGAAAVAMSVAAAEPAVQVADEAERLDSGGGLLNADSDPATGRVPAFGGSGSVALDYQRRSVAADTAAQHRIEGAELVLSASGSAPIRLSAADYTLWISDDNITYQPVLGWSFESRSEDGRTIHAFDGFEATGRYLKINTRYQDTAFTAVLRNLSADVRVFGLSEPPPEVVNDTGLEVVDRGVAYADDSESAFRPAAVRAPNGDILAVFNTTGDVQAGGLIRLIRSTDDGRTWGDPVTLKAPSLFENGSVWSSRGMTTLSDGTILLPFNEGVNYSPYNNRDSVLYVARSTDSGQTWDGLDEPVELPAQTREHWACCSRVLELDDGSLLMSMWGTERLVEDWQTDPMRWRAAVMRSHDGGRTWTDYSTIAYDPHTPPGPLGNGSRGGGVNEVAMTQLPDGRLMAVIRYDLTGVQSPNPFWMYLSYSEDLGRTWSDPVATPVMATTPSLAAAPCTAELPPGETKLMFGYRTHSENGRNPTPLEPHPDLAAVSVTFDAGATWRHRLLLESPTGESFQDFRSAEPEFVRLDDGSILTLFQYQPGKTGTYRIGYNVVEDLTGDECAAEWEAAQAAAGDAVSVHVQRGNAGEWPYPFARHQLTVDPATTIEELAAAAAPTVTCAAGGARLSHDGRVLPARATVDDLGLHDGDVLTVSGPPGRRPADGVRVGHVEFDQAPQTRPVYGWTGDCDYGLAWDIRAQSLGLDFGPWPGRQVRAVSVRDTDGDTARTAASYSIWASDDNDTFREVTGWSFEESTDAQGRVVHRFGDLAVTERYLKIQQDSATIPETGATFTIDSMIDDVDVEFAGRACDTTVSGPAFGPLTAGAGVTCLDGATLYGSMTVRNGAVLLVRDSTVAGPLLSEGAAAVAVCDARIAGPVTITGTTGTVLIGAGGDPDGTDCGGNAVTGPVQLAGNTGGVWIGGNVVRGSLDCTENDPAPRNTGTRNVVTAPVPGQCAGL